ncbi:tetratricopeptide repeat protein [Agrobacterium vitis]|nr:tetratricopeptide repeat protein [Agrobacterium vitis]
MKEERVMTTHEVSQCRSLLAQGRVAEALQGLTALFEAHPEHAETAHYYALALHLSGRSPEAIPAFEHALQLAPDQSGLLQNMVLPLIAVGDYQRAIDIGARAVTLDGKAVGAWSNLVLALTSAKRWDEALNAARQGLALDNNEPSLLAQMGVILLELGDSTGAETHLRRALELKPDAEAFYNLGVLLHGLQRDPEACDSYTKALTLDPSHRRAANNLAASLRILGNLKGADRILKQLIGIGDAPVHRFNRACLQLLDGQWSEAWADYELRDQATGSSTSPLLMQGPRWQGEALQDQTLLVFHEQGLGDTIQFIRFLPRIADRVGHVVFVCQPQLYRLLNLSELFATPSITLLPDGADLPAYAAWAPLLSLPGLINLVPEATGQRVPYLTLEKQLFERWRDWLGEFSPRQGQEQKKTRFRIGLSWQGNPKAYGEPGRSLPLECFQPLAEFSDEIDIISLQKGVGADQQSPEGLALHPVPGLDDGPDAFVDTAALMASLDLVITSDTALAHLAGALGRPVWLLLKKAPDWRWGMDGILTDWYPTMRLFRQMEAGQWQPVLQDVAHELKVLLFAGRATDDAPDEAADGLNEAIKRHQGRDYGRAVQLYRHVLTQDFQRERVLNLLGMACLEAGERSSVAGRQAIPFCARAVAIRPSLGDHWSNFAIALDAAGLVTDGMRALRHGLLYDTGHAACLLALARRETSVGDAETAFRRAGEVLKAQPRSGHALSVYAAAALALGRFNVAEEALRRACRIEPELASHHVQLGAVLLKAKQPQAAARAWEKALTLDPGNADAWSNLGVAERNHGYADLACWIQRQGALAKPGHAESWSNLGISLMDTGREDEAILAFGKAIEARPGYADAEMALGMCLLNEGDYARGLPLYERRFLVEILGIDRTRVRLPVWQGEDLAGKSILVLAEQGFGDAFQFVRYVALLKEKGAAKVMIGCRRKIATLLQTVPGVDGVVCESDPVPPLDYHVFMMSLPLLCGTVVETIPAFPAYLFADPLRVRRWAGFLAAKPGFRVGLVWQGNPDPQVDKGRSFPLQVLAPLAAIDGVRLIALQKGAGEEQLDMVDFAVERPPEDFDSGADAFADTAAMIMNLDLVITSDTAVAHLAGALGRPTWVILKSHAEWRWLRDRSDSPWYPASRVFRRVADEVEAEPFAGVVSRVAEALGRLVEGDRAQLFEAAEPVVAVPAQPGPQQRLAAAIRTHMAGNVTAAEATYAALLHEDETRAEALHMLGGLAVERLHYHRGYVLLRGAAALGLATPTFQTNYAIALRHVGKQDEAEACLRQSLDGSPSAEAYMTLGNLLRDTDRYGQALEAYRASIQLRPDLSKAHRGLGNALREMGRVEEAIASLDRALDLLPGDVETLIDRAHAHLMAGNLPQGFRDYETRWQGAEMVARTLPMPRWTGEALPDKVLLIHGEQGLGDQIQFARFVRQAALKVGHVILELREPLIGLFSTLVVERRNITLRRQGVDAIDDADVEAPIMSLPLIFATTLETLPGPANFRPDPRRVADWEARFGHRDALRVGLVWQGNPVARADKGRSPPLKVLEPLFAVEGAHFISLQFKDGLEQMAGLDFAKAMQAPGAELGDFGETAAAIAALDLVISSCTSTLHLAASLGVPCFALLKYGADWRWMTGRDDSPWYPGLKLFRQPQPGDWASVAKAVAEDLKRLVERKP